LQRRQRSGKDIHDCFAVSVFGGEEGAFLDVVDGLGADAHRGEDGGVEIHDGDRFLDCNEWAREVIDGEA